MKNIPKGNIAARCTSVHLNNSKIYGKRVNIAYPVWQVRRRIVFGQFKKDKRLYCYKREGRERHCLSMELSRVVRMSVMSVQSCNVHVIIHVEKLSLARR